MPYFIILSYFIFQIFAGIVLRRGNTSRTFSLLFTLGLVCGSVLSAGYIALDSITKRGINNAVIYHLFAGLEGADFSEHIDKIFFVLVGSAVVLLVSKIAYSKTRIDSAHSEVSQKSRRPFVSLITLIGGLACLGIHPATVDIIKVLDPRGSETVSSDDFVYADLSNIHVVERPKNIVLIYMESLERTFMDPVLFPDLVSELPRFEKEYSGYSNIGQTIGAYFTVGGMVASQCGVPLIIDGHNNSLNTNSFLQGATCMSDITKANGYHNEYMGGASLEFAGKGAFYRSHAYDLVRGRDELIPLLEDPDYVSTWGLQDDSLFELAFARFDELSRENAPFLLTMLTLDTHMPGGHGDTNKFCQRQDLSAFDTNILKSIKCADMLVSEFVTRLQEHPAASDTVIVLMSDHLVMGNESSDKLVDVKRRNFLSIVAPEQQGKGVSDRIATTLDVGPTVLNAAGFGIERLGFGVALNSEVQNLTEKLGFTEENSNYLHEGYFSNLKGFFRSLWNYPSIDNLLRLDRGTDRLFIGKTEFQYPLFATFDDLGDIKKLEMRDRKELEPLFENLMELSATESFFLIEECTRFLAHLPGDLKSIPDLCILSGRHEDGVYLDTLGSENEFNLNDKFQQGQILSVGVEDARELFRQLISAYQPQTKKSFVPTFSADKLDILVPGAQTSVKGYIGVDGAWPIWPLDAHYVSDGISIYEVLENSLINPVASLDPCASSREELKALFDAVMFVNAKQNSAAFQIITIGDRFNCKSDDAFKLISDAFNLKLMQNVEPGQPYLAVRTGLGEFDEYTDRNQNPLSLSIEVEASEVIPRVYKEEVIAKGKAIAQTSVVVEDNSERVDYKNPILERLTSLKISGLPRSLWDQSICSNPSGPKNANLYNPLLNLTGGNDIQLLALDFVSLGQNWWDAERGSSWLSDNTGSIILKMPKTSEKFTNFITNVNLHHSKELEVKISYGDEDLINQTVQDGDTIAFDISELPKEQIVVLNIEVSGDNPVCNKAMGVGSDIRNMLLNFADPRIISSDQNLVSRSSSAGYCMLPGASFRDSTKQFSQTKIFPEHKIWIETRKPSEFINFTNGWWYQENFGRWLGARDSSIELTLPVNAQQSSIVFEGYTNEKAFVPINVYYDGKFVVSGLFSAKNPLVIPTKNLPKGREIELTFEVPLNKNYCSSSGQIVSGDFRNLIAFFESVELRLDASPLPMMIAHAGGDINGHRKTNSLDAFQGNSTKYKFFEVDLNWTSDRELVCLHNWSDEFDALFGSGTKRPVSHAQFSELSSQLKGRENCTLSELVSWLRTDPANYLVTDIKENNVLGLRKIAQDYPDILSQIVPQAYKPLEIQIAKQLGYENVIWTLYAFGTDYKSIQDVLAAHDLFALTMPWQFAQGGLSALVKQHYDIPIFAHTVNEISSMSCLSQMGVDGFYTDSVFIVSELDQKPEDCLGRELN